VKAVRIHRFGPPEVIVIDDVPLPSPGEGEVLVRVAAAGVGPWDAIIREGRSKVSPQPPLTLGSDLSGVIEAVGPSVTGFRVDDGVYGVTNPQFCGAQAECAVASARMIAPMPKNLSNLDAASAPVIAVAAHQMLFEYAVARPGDPVMITGAAGNVGAYAVQLALQAGVHVVAVARPEDDAVLRRLGAKIIVDSSGTERLPEVEAVLDTVGGDTAERCVSAIRPGGKFVSVVSEPVLARTDIKSIFFYAEVTTERLRALSSLFEDGRISARTGTILPLAQARIAHEMLAGAPHKPGKIVLQI
jgi:NADPH:quinone reductase-like Zn-dependent oxidoreductase